MLLELEVWVARARGVGRSVSAQSWDTVVETQGFVKKPTQRASCWAEWFIAGARGTTTSPSIPHRLTVFAGSLCLAVFLWCGVGWACRAGGSGSSRGTGGMLSTFVFYDDRRGQRVGSLDLRSGSIGRGRRGYRRSGVAAARRGRLWRGTGRPLFTLLLHGSGAHGFLRGSRLAEVVELYKTPGCRWIGSLGVTTGCACHPTNPFFWRRILPGRNRVRR